MAPRNSELRRPSYSELELGAQSLPSPELQALLSLYNSDACWRQGPTLARSKVKNFERPQMAPASAVCGELVFPPQRIKIYLTATCKFSGQRRVLAGYTCVSKCHENTWKRSSSSVREYSGIRGIYGSPEEMMFFDFPRKREKKEVQECPNACFFFLQVARKHLTMQKCSHSFSPWRFVVRLRLFGVDQRAPASNRHRLI